VRCSWRSATCCCWPPMASMNIPMPTSSRGHRRRRRPRRGGARSPRPCARGSGDNLTVQLIRIDELPEPGSQRALPPGLRPALPAAAGGARRVRGLPDRPRHQAQRAQPHLPGGRRGQRRARRDQDPVGRHAGQPGGARALPARRVDRPPHQQRARAQALPQTRSAEHLRRHRIHRGPDPGAMDDRQSEARPADRARPRWNRSPRACRPSTGWRCCIRT
jgi:hypothetical protein